MPYRKPAAFDPQRAIAWLGGPAVVEPTGHVLSWHNPRHPGYRYPEAAGVLLSLASCTPGVLSDQSAHCVAQRLLATAQDDRVGRDDVRYVFDEGVVLAALLRDARGPRRRCTDSSVLQPLYERFVDRLARRDAATPTPAVRWSTRWSVHQLKAAVTIGEWSDVTEHERKLLTSMLDQASARRDAGRFLTASNRNDTYVHAHCYAVEGALRMAAPDLVASSTRDRAQHIASAGAAWLARIQRADGGLPSWHNGVVGRGPVAADATAQAIRIWSALDQAAYASAIDRALTCLAALTTADGAVRYHGDSDDKNTWCTVFAVQAHHWAHGHSDVQCLV